MAIAAMLLAAGAVALVFLGLFIVLWAAWLVLYRI